MKALIEGGQDAGGGESEVARAVVGTGHAKMQLRLRKHNRVLAGDWVNRGVQSAFQAVNLKLEGHIVGEGCGPQP